LKNRPGYLSGVILGAVAAAFVAVTAGGASAEYPDKPITFIVPYSPGGGSDQQARRLQAGLEKELGVEIRIVYKTGGGGAIGFNELWGKDVGFKPGEFSYIGMTARAVGVILVPKGSKYGSLEEFVAAAKANPGKLTSAGVGNTGARHHAEITEILGIKTTYVPVSGGVGKMMPMLQGKHVDSGITSATHAVRHRATVDAILTAGPEPVAALGVPNEPQWSYATTWGVMAPPGTPADRIAILNAALNKVTADPAFTANVEKVGLSQLRQTPAEAKAYVEAAVKKYSK
jgi:tripartite-type tricarboxylate transporter receptor subunit TctC